MLSDNTYVGKAEGTNYIQLDRIDIDVKNFNREDTVFQEYNISEETLDNIQETIAYAQENNNNQLEISLYSINPSLTEYISVGNNRYRNTYEEVRDASFKPIETTGYNTKNNLSLAKSFFITVFSVCSEDVNLVATGISLLQFIQNETGLRVATPTKDDWAYTSIFYDKLIKHTAIERNTTWQEGCVSQKLWINKAAVWAYFRSTGKSDEKVDSPINKIYYTKNWNNCFNVTLYNWATGAIKDSNIQMNYNGVTWVFK